MPENAQTRNGVRYYTWQGREYLSVTSLRRLLGVPFGLANWMVSNALEAGIKMSDDVTRRVADGDKHADIKRMLRKEAESERDTKADRGTRVHEAAEQGTKVEDAEEDVAPFLQSYYDFLERTGAKVLAQEGQVFNLTLGYAGSFDLIIDIMVDGVMRRVCVDIKTGDNIYADHALQLMGYAKGEFVGKNDIVATDTTALLHSCTDMAVLHLQPGGWELSFLEVTPSLNRQFEHMCGLAQWFHANQTIDNLIRETISG